MESLRFYVNALWPSFNNFARDSGVCELLRQVSYYIFLWGRTCMPPAYPPSFLVLSFMHELLFDNDRTRALHDLSDR